MRTSRKCSCPGCENYFEVTPTLIRHGRDKHCSLRCKYKHASLNGRKKIVCRNYECKKEISRKKSRLRGNGGFCSLKCAGRYKHLKSLRKYVCCNPKCRKGFKRKPCKVKNKKAVYCGNSCANKMNRKKRKTYKLKIAA